MRLIDQHDDFINHLHRCLCWKCKKAIKRITCYKKKGDTIYILHCHGKRERFVIDYDTMNKITKVEIFNQVWFFKPKEKKNARRS